MHLVKKLMFCLFGVLLLSGCGQESESTIDPRIRSTQQNYFQITHCDSLESTFARLNHYGSLGAGKRDIDICLYGGLTRIDFLTNGAVDYAMAMLYLDLVSDTVSINGEGCYEINTSAESGTIQYATLLYSAEGMNNGVNPTEYRVTQGTFFMNEEEGGYRFFFNGQLENGESVIVEYHGIPYIDD